MTSPSFADYDSQYLSSRQTGVRFLPTSKSDQLPPRNRQNTSTAKHLSPLSQEVVNVTQHQRHGSSSSATTSAATSRSSTATSVGSHHAHQGHMSAKAASLKAQEIRPTSDVAEWAHQAHIRQGRSYWWCQGCFPKEVAEPLPIPKAVEKAMTGRRVRINEPSHCYDI